MFINISFLIVHTVVAACFANTYANSITAQCEVEKNKMITKRRLISFDYLKIRRIDPIAKR